MLGEGHLRRGGGREAEAVESARQAVAEREIGLGIVLAERAVEDLAVQNGDPELKHRGALHHSPLRR
jgi:hypothetical protein